MKKSASLFFILFIFSITNALAADNFSHGISMFGDLKYPKNAKNFDYANPNAKKGGSIKYGIEGGFNSLNPFILKGIPASGMNLIYASLMEKSDDEISSYYGFIAKSAYLAKDNSFIIFKLRDEAQFSDGIKITAADVIFTFEILQKEAHPSYQMALRDLAKVEKINNHEVKFIFKNKNNRDLPFIIAEIPILPKHYYKKVKFNETSLIAPIGSGPYEISKIEPKKSISYKRHENYWGKDLLVNKGRYNFDEISFDYYRDNNVLVEAFKAGNYDVRQENIARNWANSYNIDKVKKGEILKKEIIHHLPSNTQTFILNLRHQKFQDIALRKALTYAFDFEWLQKRIFYGSYQRTTSYFPNSIFASQALPSKKEQKLLQKLRQKFPNDVPQQALNTEFKMPFSDASGWNRDNLLKATQILQDAGYKLIDGKLIDKNTNKQLEIEFLINSNSFEMVIAPLIKNLARLGIKGKALLIEENQYQSRVNNFDFDVIVTVFGQGLIPGNELLAYYHSAQKDVKGARNLAGINNKAVDELIERIVKSKDKEELIILCQVLDRIMLWNYYTILQWHNNSYRILYKNKFAMPQITPDYSLGIENWWEK